MLLPVPSLARLPDLALDDLALIPHALALVRVGLADLADLGGDLADQLLVDTADPQAGGRLDGEGDPLGGLHRHRVAEAQGELEVRAARLDAVTDTDDLEGLGVALGDAGDHVGDESPGQPVQAPALSLVVGPLHTQG